VESGNALDTLAQTIDVGTKDWHGHHRCEGGNEYIVSQSLDSSFNEVGYTQ
jgi:hypothetical protein